MTTTLKSRLMADIAFFTGLLDMQNYMRVQHQLASGTGAGNNVVGLQTRALNTTINNTITGASLNGSNQVLLPIGTYLIKAIAHAYDTNLSKLRIYNVTSAAYIAEGHSYNVSSAGGNDFAYLSVWTLVTFAVATTIRLDMYSSTIGTNGLGVPVSSGAEIYADMEIFKVG